MSSETLAEARRLLAEHNYHHDDALFATLDRAHAAEQSLREADAEIERLKGEITRLRSHRARHVSMLDRVEALAGKFERWPSSPSLAVAARHIREALDPS